MDKIDRKITLLEKYKNDDELYELIDLVRLGDSEDAEKFCFANGRYPEKRDLLGVLKFELKVRQAGTSSN